MGTQYGVAKRRYTPVESFDFLRYSLPPLKCNRVLELPTGCAAARVSQFPRLSDFEMDSGLLSINMPLVCHHQFGDFAIPKVAIRENPLNVFFPGRRRKCAFQT